MKNWLGNLFGAMIVICVGFPILFHTAEYGFDLQFIIKVVLISNLIAIPLAFIMGLIALKLEDRRIKCKEIQ